MSVFSTKIQQVGADSGLGLVFTGETLIHNSGVESETSSEDEYKGISKP